MKTNVIEYLIETARKYPDKVALVDQKHQITFGELDREAKKVAAAILRACGAIKNRPIVVYMEKSVDCIVSFLGAVYSGNFYSPIDIKMPQERIKRILDVLEPEFVIFGAKKLEVFDPPDRQLPLEQILTDTTLPEGINSFRQVLDTDPVYVLFTSGSTGQPKGVVISHRGVIDYAEWLKDTFHFSSETIFGNQAPFYFDNSILDIYSTLKNGAKMVIIPERLFLFPGSLVEYLNTQKINTLFWVPSALIGVANSGVLETTDIPSLQKVLFCGEVMPNKQLNVWRKRYPDILYANLYGPTEITDVCTYYIVDRQFTDSDPLPIGIPCRNTEILVLNEADQAVQVNETGELCVRGSCLSSGYYNNKEKSDAVFVQNPLNSMYRDIIYRTGDLVKYNEFGEIIYLGRKDFQIKYQGYRIELGEIETAAYGISQMKQCCAVYDTDNQRILLHCVLGTPVSERKIFSFLKEKIPGYMLPKRIVIRDALPLNANGKIDRLALKKELDR